MPLTLKEEVITEIKAAEFTLDERINYATNVSQQNHDSMRALAIAQIATAKAIMYLADIVSKSDG